MQKIMYLPGSLLFFLFMSFSAMVIGLIALFTKPFPLRIRYWVTSRWGKVNLVVLRWTCGIRMQVERRGHTPDGPAIVLCKHQSAWETLALQELFPPQTWVLKQELLNLPFFGWALSVLDPIAIDRTAGRKALQQLVDEGMERLNQGLWVMIFPEGTRVRPGARGHYNVGGPILAVKAADQGVPIVPMAHNAGHFWPRNGFLKYPGTIHVVIGEPKDVSNMKASEVKTWVETWIEGEMDKLPSP